MSYCHENDEGIGCRVKGNIPVCISLSWAVSCTVAIISVCPRILILFILSSSHWGKKDLLLLKTAGSAEELKHGAWKGIVCPKSLNSSHFGAGVLHWAYVVPALTFPGINLNSSLLKRRLKWSPAPGLSTVSCTYPSSIGAAGPGLQPFFHFTARGLTLCKTPDLLTDWL